MFIISRELANLIKNLPPKHQIFYFLRLKGLGFEHGDEDGIIEFVRNDDYLMLLEYYNEVLAKLRSMFMYKEIRYLTEDLNIYVGYVEEWEHDELWLELDKYEKLYEKEVKRRKSWEEFAQTLKYEEQNGQVVITL